jgi:hypothetical protein
VDVLSSNARVLSQQGGLVGRVLHRWLRVLAVPCIPRAASLAVQEELPAVHRVAVPALLRVERLVLVLVRVPASVHVHQDLAERLVCRVQVRLQLVSVQVSVLDNGAAVSVTRRPKKAQ